MIPIMRLLPAQLRNGSSVHTVEDEQDNRKPNCSDPPRSCPHVRMDFNEQYIVADMVGFKLKLYDTMLQLKS